MAKTKKSKAQVALEQKIDEMKRQKKELQSRIREAEMQLSVMTDKRVTPTKDMPLRKLVHTSRMDAFRKILEVWQECSDGTIDIRSANRIVFMHEARHQIIRSLKIALSCDVPIFNTSNRQLFMYLAEHSNLGTWESLKQAVKRYPLKSGDIDSFFNDEPFIQKALRLLSKGQNGDKTDKRELAS